MPFPDALSELPTDNGSRTNSKTGAPKGGPVGYHSGLHNSLSESVNGVEETLDDWTGPEGESAIERVGTGFAGPVVQRDWRETRRYGIRMNGEDESDKWLDALTECGEQGLALNVPAGVTGVSKSLLAEIGAGFGLCGAGAGKTIFECHLPESAAFDLRGPALGNGDLTTTVATLTATAKAGESILTVDSTAGLQAEDILAIKDVSQQMYGNNPKEQVGVSGEMIRVREVVSSTQVRLRGQLAWESYTAGSTVRVVDFAPEPLIGGFTLRDIDPDSGTAAARGLRLRGTFLPRLPDIGVEFFNGPGIYLDYCLGYHIHNPLFRNMHEAGANGYGIVSGAMTSHGLVTNPRGVHGRHVFTTAQNDNEIVPQRVHVKDGFAWEHAFAPWDTHPGSRWIYFENCGWSNSRTEGTSGGGGGGGIGCQLRGPDQWVINPHGDGGSIGVAIVAGGADRCGVRGGVLRNMDVCVKIANSDEATVTGDVQMYPREKAVEIGAEAASWAGYPKRHHLRSFTVHGKPSGAAVENVAPRAGLAVRVGAVVEIPDAATRLAGIGVAEIAEQSPLVNKRLILPERQALNKESTELQDLNGLAFTAGAGEEWAFRLFLAAKGASSVPDLKAGFNLPAGAKVKFQSPSNLSSVGTGATQNALREGTVEAGLGGFEYGLLYEGSFEIGGTAGTVKVQASQNTKSADEVAIELGSYLTAFRVK